EQTKREYKKAVKKLYSDYLDSKKPEFDGDEFCDFFTLTVSESYTDPDRLPGPKEVRELVKAADRLRDKAFIMTLWSTGGRIGEILGLKWKDVKFRNDIATVVFRDTKTGGNREVPVVSGYLYLRDLKEADARGDEPEAFLFRSLQDDTQLSHNGACNIIQRARKYTGIPERVKTNPHAFRKGRATFLASQGMNQAELCAFGGWVQGSREVAKYIRMGKSDVEASVRRVAGMEPEDDPEEEDLNPVQCHQCGELNKFEATNCTTCGEVLETAELFNEVQVERAKDALKDRMIKEKVGIDDDRMDELAEQVVEEEMGAG
ncbi:MAG: tyrosine-type recombinase/integrase, partial [Candidatus Nanohaloarchaea archaeon]